MGILYRVFRYTPSVASHSKSLYPQLHADADHIAIQVIELHELFDIGMISLGNIPKGIALFYCMKEKGQGGGLRFRPGNGGIREGDTR